MSADAFVLFYGVRHLVADEEEIRQLEERTHSKLRAARGVGLQHWWGDTIDEETHYLIIGRRLGNLGWEGSSDIAITKDQFLSLIQDTEAKLQQAGFEDVPALHAQFEPGR